MLCTLPIRCYNLLQMIHIEIKGKIPSKKNARRPFIRNGRIMNFPSKKYDIWHRDASNQLLGKIPAEPIKKCSVFIELHVPTLHRADLSNRAESILDLLVDNEVIEDDNYFVVSYVSLEFCGVDKKNPRAVIKIEETE